MAEKVIVEGQPLRQEAPAEPMVTRKLRQGARHWSAGAGLLVGGQEVQLTKAQELAFADKLEPKDASEMSKVDAPGVENNFDPEDKDFQKAMSQRPVPTSHSPQDIGAKSITPGLPLVNPENATRIPLPPAASNPSDGDVPEGQRAPIRESHTAANVGGPVTPASLAAPVPAPNSPVADRSEKSALRPEEPLKSAPSAPASRPPSAPSAGPKK